MVTPMELGLESPAVQKLGLKQHLLLTVLGCVDIYLDNYLWFMVHRRGPFS